MDWEEWRGGHVYAWWAKRAGMYEHPQIPVQTLNASDADVNVGVQLNA